MNAEEAKLRAVRPSALRRVVKYLTEELGLEVVGPYRTIERRRVQEHYGMMNYSIKQIMDLRAAYMAKAEFVEPEDLRG